MRSPTPLFFHKQTYRSPIRESAVPYKNTQHIIHHQRTCSIGVFSALAIWKFPKACNQHLFDDDHQKQQQQQGRRQYDLQE